MNSVQDNYTIPIENNFSENWNIPTQIFSPMRQITLESRVLSLINSVNGVINMAVNNNITLRRYVSYYEGQIDWIADISSGTDVHRHAGVDG